jgi:hypothetical protein
MRAGVHELSGVLGMTADLRLARAHLPCRGMPSPR